MLKIPEPTADVQLDAGLRKVSHQPFKADEPVTAETLLAYRPINPDCEGLAIAHRPIPWMTLVCVLDAMALSWTLLGLSPLQAERIPMWGPAPPWVLALEGPVKTWPPSTPALCAMFIASFREMRTKWIRTRVERAEETNLESIGYYGRDNFNHWQQQN